jgi:hypothetical protein
VSQRSRVARVPENQGLGAIFPVTKVAGFIESAFQWLEGSRALQQAGSQPVKYVGVPGLNL